MSAVLSPCGRYRYRLDREINLMGLQGITIAYFGVNPSTADATVEDATTRRWMGFAAREGASRYIAGNPFAFRSKSVRALANAQDPVGPDNDAHIAQIIADADLLVPCWGARAKVPRRLHGRLDALLNTLKASGKPVKVFGWSQTGDPLHPLFLAGSTPLVDIDQFR